MNGMFDVYSHEPFWEYQTYQGLLQYDVELLRDNFEVLNSNLSHSLSNFAIFPSKRQKRNSGHNRSAL